MSYARSHPTRAEQPQPDIDGLARAVVDNVIEGILVIDGRGIIGEANPAACAMFGYTADELVGRNVSMLMGAPEAAAHDGYLARYLATGERHIIGVGREVEGRRRDGRRVPLELSVVHLTVGSQSRFVGVMRDLTERRANAARAAFDHAQTEAVARAWDQFIAGNRWSKARLFHDALSDLLELTGSRSGFVGETIASPDGTDMVQIVASTDNNAHSTLLGDDPRIAPIVGGDKVMTVSEGAGAPYMGLAIHAGQRLAGVVGLHGRHGGYDRQLAEQLQPLLGALGSIVVGLHKVEAQRAAERELYRTQERLRELATRDALTGTMNRAALYEALGDGFRRSREMGLPLSVLFLDIDHFKAVNDTHGHAAGDEVLRAVARAVGASVRPQDILGRIGGEEFVVGLLETDRKAARAAAERVRVAVAQMPAQIPVTISLGLACLEPSTPSLDSLLANADAALYRAKRGGRNRVEG